MGDGERSWGWLKSDKTQREVMNHMSLGIAWMVGAKGGEVLQSLRKEKVRKE